MYTNGGQNIEHASFTNVKLAGLLRWIASHCAGVHVIVSIFVYVMETWKINANNIIFFNHWLCC